MMHNNKERSVFFFFAFAVPPDTPSPTQPTTEAAITNMTFTLTWEIPRGVNITSLEYIITCKAIAGKMLLPFWNISKFACPKQVRLEGNITSYVFVPQYSFTRYTFKICAQRSSSDLINNNNSRNENTCTTRTIETPEGR